MSRHQDADRVRVAWQAAALGATFGMSISSALYGYRDYVYLYYYSAALSSFHFLEYWSTARYNPSKASSESFLLWGNGVRYWLAQAIGVFEYFVRLHLVQARAPWQKSRFTVGLLMVLLGQSLRSTAMATAGRSFSHLLVRTKTNEHELVTHGIYSYARHPSYLGFFCFAIGTQFMLGNLATGAIFAVILWRFFSHRIGEEEKYLLSFFGKDYADYRLRVASGMPFID
ncbi:farnesyl cysteine-carboxyl methyltransferase [Savitreella phatthalungensis]